MVKMANYTQKCEQKCLKISNRGKGVGIKMSWVEKNRKINNQGGRGGGEGLGDYLGLQSKSCKRQSLI